MHNAFYKTNVTILLLALHFLCLQYSSSGLNTKMWVYTCFANKKKIIVDISDLEVAFVLVVNKLLCTQIRSCISNPYFSALLLTYAQSQILV